MPGTQGCRLGKAGGADQLQRRFYGLAMKASDPFGFVDHHEADGQGRILRRDADGALVAVAHAGLNAAEREHHGAGRVGDVSAEREQAGEAEPAGDLAGGDDAELVAEAAADQRVVRKDKAIDQWRADRIRKFDRCGAGAALAAVPR